MHPSFFAHLPHLDPSGGTSRPAGETVDVYTVSKYLSSAIFSSDSELSVQTSCVHPWRLGGAGVIVTPIRRRSVLTRLYECNLTRDIHLQPEKAVDEAGLSPGLGATPGHV